MHVTELTFDTPAEPTGHLSSRLTPPYFCWEVQKVINVCDN